MNTTRQKARPRFGLMMLVVVAPVGAMLLTSSPAQESKPETAAPLTELRIIEKVRTSTDRALDYLEQQQHKQGATAGGWSTNHALNSLAVLAFLSSGHVPGRG